jgi:NAD(P)-dependent dehydrogenase (short-subunit alcohol dehydrogenase family)
VREFAGKVAVVTGAASGIGLALARELGGRGMRVALADIDADSLQSAALDLEKRGVETLAVPTDVTRADSVSALAQRTLDAFGGVHVVCNNAGVFAGGLCWESPLEDYHWVLNVNVWGVIHGIRTFVPILLEQGVEGHVVNTASMAAVTNMPYSGIYSMSKHAVLALSESLYHELKLRGAKVGVSALCPELISTGIADAERSRPAELRRPEGAPPSPERELTEQAIREAMKTGLPPEAIAERVVEAIREQRFYILSDDVWRRCCEVRHEDIRQERNPTFAPPIDEGAGTGIAS